MLRAAHQKLLATGRPNRSLLATSTPPIDALMQLLYFAEDGNTLTCTQPWSLDPALCRRLEDATDMHPPGGWARIAALAVGAKILEARPDRFVPLIPSEQLPMLIGDGFTVMAEAFTRRLTPPGAAAAIYVSLDVHPLWGFELGHYVGAFQKKADIPGADETFPHVRDFVFGTLAGLMTTMRSLATNQRYSVDQLGEVLFQCIQAARELAGIETLRNTGLPVLLDDAPTSQRQITTSLAAGDVLDAVFVPAGVCRRDDAGGFSVDHDALLHVGVGDWTLDQQEQWWAAALALELREAC